MTIDVREAEAGRGLDMACAKAMEWTFFQVPRGQRFSCQNRMATEGQWLWLAPGGDVYWEVLCYSTDIAAAWELVEGTAAFDLSKASWGWECFMIFLDERGKPQPQGEAIAAFAETAPLAIARAFLLAHGVKQVEVP